MDVLYNNNSISAEGRIIMNKKEMITAIAEKSGLTQKETGKALEAIIATVSGGLRDGEHVAIPRLGSFEVRTRAAREGRNPRTGETVTIPEKRIPVFKAAKALKDAVE